MTITMMPDIAQRIGIPRALGVPFPFGHPLGHAGDAHEHRLVLGRALELLAGADEGGKIVELDVEWANPESDWHKRWQPSEPSPIVKALRDSARGASG